MEDVIISKQNISLFKLVKQAVAESIQEVFSDPDFGLDLQESIKKRLNKAPKKLVSFEQIKKTCL